MTVEINVDLSPKQLDVVEAKERIVAYVGGIGSGKTYCGVIWAICIQALQWPGSMGLIGANTYTQLTQSTLAPMFGFLEETGLPYIFGRRPPWYQSKLAKHDGVLSLENGSQIITRTLENYDALRGIQVGWAWLDETRDTPRAAWDVVQGRIRGAGSGQTLITTTPDGYNWLYELLVLELIDKPELRDQRRWVHASIYDNAANLPDQYITNLESMYDPEFARQELGGEFLNVGVGRVYTTFDRREHVVQDDVYEWNPDRALYLSCDFNVSPMCWAIFQFNAKGEAVFIDEIHRKTPRGGMSPTQSAAWDFIDAYWAQRAPLYVYGDYYGTSRDTRTTVNDYMVIMDAIREADRMICPVELMAGNADTKGNPPVVDRIAAMCARLRNARGEIGLRVHARCTNLIRDLEQVTYKVNTTGKREIDKARNPDLTHASDAAGYLIYSLYGAPSLRGAGSAKGAPVRPERTGAYAGVM